MAVVDFKKAAGGALRRRRNEAYDEEDAREELYGGAPEEDTGEDLSESGVKRRRFVLLMRLLLAAAVIGVIAVFFIQRQSVRNYTAYEIRDSVPVSFPESSRLLDLGGKILTCSRDGASLIDSSGKAQWNITYEMQSPMVVTSGDSVAIADEGGSVIHVMNVGGSVGTINTNMPISTIAVAENGSVAAVLEDTSVSWVYLYDSAGKTVAYIKRSMDQSGYPLAAALSPDGRLLALSQLSVDGADIKTSIAFYNFGAVGQNAVENCVSGYDYRNEVIPFVRFLNREISVAVSDSRIAFFNGADIPKSQADTFFSTRLSGVYTNEDFCALLFPDTTGNDRYELQFFNTAGRQIGTLTFSMDYTSIRLDGDRAIITDGQRCLIASVNGDVRFDGTFTESAALIIPTSTANKFLLVTKDAIETAYLR